MYKMYLIKEYPFKIQVPCQHCSDRGYINKTCNACNGKGIHNKTLTIYKVGERVKDIDKIDRDSETGDLRYWEDMSCYFPERLHLIHFNIKDARSECSKRNIEKYGIDFYRQYLRQ